jgi:alcohol dehydrogenase
VDTTSTPMLLKAVGAHRIDPTLLITHWFKFDDTLAAYDTFAHGATSKVLKVLIEVRGKW